eukprot:968731_1
MSGDDYKVSVYKYDLSDGKVNEIVSSHPDIQSLATQVLGRPIHGIWHTGLVVYEKEYFFGGGIQKESPGGTMFGEDFTIIDMGTTSKTESEFNEFLAEITPRFKREHYSLLSHNCNTFTNECVGFLTGEQLPQDIITGLPDNVIQVIEPLLGGSLSDIQSRFNALSSTSDQPDASQQQTVDDTSQLFRNFLDLLREHSGTDGDSSSDVQPNATRMIYNFIRSADHASPTGPSGGTGRGHPATTSTTPSQQPATNNFRDFLSSVINSAPGRERGGTSGGLGWPPGSSGSHSNPSGTSNTSQTQTEVRTDEELERVQSILSKFKGTIRYNPTE